MHRIWDFDWLESTAYIDEYPGHQSLVNLDIVFLFLPTCGCIGAANDTGLFVECIPIQPTAISPILTGKTPVVQIQIRRDVLFEHFVIRKLNFFNR